MKSGQGTVLPDDIGAIAPSTSLVLAPATPPFPTTISSKNSTTTASASVCSLQTAGIEEAGRTVVNVNGNFSTAKPATAKPATAKPATAKPATAKPAPVDPVRTVSPPLGYSPSENGNGEIKDIESGPRKQYSQYSEELVPLPPPTREVDADASVDAVEADADKMEVDGANVVDGLSDDLSAFLQGDELKKRAIGGEGEGEGEGAETASSTENASSTDASSTENAAKKRRTLQTLQTVQAGGVKTGAPASVEIETPATAPETAPVRRTMPSRSSKTNAKVKLEGWQFDHDDYYWESDDQGSAKGATKRKKETSEASNNQEKATEHSGRSGRSRRRPNNQENYRRKTNRKSKTAARKSISDYSAFVDVDDDFYFDLDEFSDDGVDKGNNETDRGPGKRSPDFYLVGWNVFEDDGHGKGVFQAPAMPGTTFRCSFDTRGGARAYDRIMAGKVRGVTSMGVLLDVGNVSERLCIAEAEAGAEAGAAAGAAAAAAAGAEATAVSIAEEQTIVSNGNDNRPQVLLSSLKKTERKGKRVITEKQEKGVCTGSNGSWTIVAIETPGGTTTKNLFGTKLYLDPNFDTNFESTNSKNRRDSNMKMNQTVVKKKDVPKKVVRQTELFRTCHDLEYRVSGTVFPSSLLSFGSILSILSPSSIIVYDKTHLKVPHSDQPDYVHRKDKVKVTCTPGQLIVFDAALVHRGLGREGDNYYVDPTSTPVDPTSTPVKNTRKRVKMLCDGCNPDSNRDLTVVSDLKTSRFRFCPLCREKLDTIRGHFYLEGLKKGEKTRKQASRTFGTRGDMNIIECGPDCKLCGPDIDAEPEEIFMTNEPTENKGRNGRPYIAGGNLKERGWVVIDLADKNICDLKELYSLPEAIWSKIFNTDGLKNPRPGFRRQCELNAIPALSEIARIVKEKAVPIIEKISCTNITLKDPVLLRTDFNTDEQDAHRDWPRRLMFEN